jgi:hypothetical protein
LGCDWHTVTDTVVAYGHALVDGDPDRFGAVGALGLDGRRAGLLLRSTSRSLER